VIPADGTGSLRIGLNALDMARRFGAGLVDPIEQNRRQG